MHFKDMVTIQLSSSAGGGRRDDTDHFGPFIHCHHNGIKPGHWKLSDKVQADTLPGHHR